MKRYFITALVMLIAGMGMQAQQVITLPIDSAVRFGQLENGLTYYIRHNEKPAQRAEFHIAQAVGAILEEDDQNGLAHFLEHMCFNGTEHFEGKGIINYFESVGVNFGGDINAYTSLDQTVYRLSNVPTTREGIIDSALLVMHDWSCAVSLLPEEIDAERGVIREEWRTGATASRRMWKASNALMYPGSQYAKRDVIGDTAVINNFSYDALRAYYHKWYGPDLQAIVVVGDIDVDAIEAKIKALWANVPARQNRGERPLHSVDDNKEPILAIVQDAEAQYPILYAYCKHDALPLEYRASNVSFVMDIMDMLNRRMMSQRWQEICMKPDAPILQGMSSYDKEMVKEKAAFEGVVVAKEGQEKAAFQLLMSEIEKVRRYGFTDSELELVKADLLSSYEKQYNERNAQENIRYVNQYINHYLHQEEIPGIETEYQMIQEVLPAITVDMLNQRAASYWTDENVIINIQAPKKAEVILPTNEEILATLAGMSQLAIEAPKSQKIETTLVKKAPKIGKIKKTKYNEDLGTVEWTLKNGIKVILKHTDFKQDEILFSAYSEGGLSLIDDQDLPSAEMATDIIEYCGIGKFSATDLQKALSGKHVSLSPSISALTEDLDGSTTVKDLETLLQLAYLYFTEPREDEEAYASFMAMLEQYLKNKDKNPKQAFSDSIQLMASNHSPRTILMTEETLRKVDMRKAIEIYRERFANPADFTFFFVGNIDPADKATQKLICTWLGGLKTTKQSEHFTDRKVRAPQGVQKNYFAKDMQTKTASNRIQFSSYDIPYSRENAMTMNLIGRILDTRYLESIREREGGSYGVGVAGRLTRQPVAEAMLLMQFDTDPDKQEKLMQIIYDEVDTIIANGPLANDLSKEKESLMKDFQQSIEKNSTWINNILYNYYRYDENLLETYEKAVQAVDAEKIQKMLGRLRESGNVFEVVMFPK